MKALVSAALFLFVPLFGALPLAAQMLAADAVSPRIAAFEAGILCSPPEISVTPAPDTVAGFTNVIEGNPPFVSFGRNVPAVLGVSFGIKARMLAEDFLPATMVVTHPPMGPDGITRQSFPTDFGSVDMALSFYELEFDYEVVMGEWTFSAITDDGETLFSAVFNVVDPRLVPELAGICGYEDLLS